MVSASKKKGTSAESAVVGYLRANWFPDAERRALRGNKDCGDVAGLPDCVAEVKAAVSHSYGTWLKEAEQERANADARYGVVIHKPVRVGVARPQDFHVVMTLETFACLLYDAAARTR